MRSLLRASPKRILIDPHHHFDRPLELLLVVSAELLVATAKKARSILQSTPPTRANNAKRTIATASKKKKTIKQERVPRPRFYPTAPRGKKNINSAKQKQSRANHASLTGS